MINLRIGDCNITEEGSQLLLDYLSENENALKVLTFNYNEVEDIKTFVQKLKLLQLKKLEIKGIAEFEDFDDIKEIMPECDILLESECEEDEEDEQTRMKKNMDQLMQDLKGLEL